MSAYLAVPIMNAALLKANIPAVHVEAVTELLLWFGFLGVYVYPDEERYSYQFEHDLKKMRTGLTDFLYCIHPAFRASLGCAG